MINYKISEKFNFSAISQELKVSEMAPQQHRISKKIPTKDEINGSRRDRLEAGCSYLAIDKGRNFRHECNKWHPSKPHNPVALWVKEMVITNDVSK